MNRIRFLREQKKMQQKELAVDLGVSQPTISDWEAGRKTPSAKSSIKLAEYFNVSVDYLLGLAELREIPDNKVQPTATGDELDEKIVSLLIDLSPSEVQRVLDFVAGLKAARKEEPSPQS